MAHNSYMTTNQPSTEEILEAAKQTLTLMTATRMAAGFEPEAAFRDAFKSFLALSSEDLANYEAAMYG